MLVNISAIVYCQLVVSTHFHWTVFLGSLCKQSLFPPVSEAPARCFSLRAYGTGLAILISGCAPSQTWMEALNCGCNHNLRQTRLHFLAKNSLHCRHLIETPWCWWTNPGSVSQASLTQATHAFSPKPPPEIAAFAGSHNSQVLKFLSTRVMAYLNTCRFSRGITLAAIWDA